MLEVICTKGIPASGKSTWAKDFVIKNKNFVRINRDSLRVMLNNYSLDDETMVKHMRNLLIDEALKSGKSVVVDECNVTSTTFRDVCKIADYMNHSVRITEKIFYIDLDEAIKRDKLRAGTDHVGDAVIKSFWSASKGANMMLYKPNDVVMIKEEPILYDPLKQSELPKAILCDVDGTFCLFNSSDEDKPIKYANVHRRSPFILDTCQNDTPNPFVVDMLKTYHEKGYKIIFCTGRSERDRFATETFITNHLGFDDYDLHMRADNDKRKDMVYKREVFCLRIKDNYNVVVALDDLDHVVAMYRSIGLAVHQVNYGGKVR